MGVFTCTLLQMHVQLSIDHYIYTVTLHIMQCTHNMCTWAHVMCPSAHLQAVLKFWTVCRHNMVLWDHSFQQMHIWSTVQGLLVLLHHKLHVLCMGSFALSCITFWDFHCQCLNIEIQEYYFARLNVNSTMRICLRLMYVFDAMQQQLLSYCGIVLVL